MSSQEGAWPRPGLTGALTLVPGPPGPPHWSHAYAPSLAVCSHTEGSPLVSLELNTEQKRVQSATFHRVSATPASPATRLGIDSKRK